MNLLNHFDDLLCCEICTEPYTEPSSNIKRIAKQLNCGHTFCLLCLEQMFEFTRSNPSIVCPTCRAITNISGGKKNITNLKNNFTILDLLETINNAKKNENEEDDVMIPITSETVMCPRHPKKELDIYCSTCDKVLCSKCLFDVTQNHQGHNCSSISSCQEEGIESIKTVDKELGIQLNSLEDLHNKLKINLLKLNQDKDKEKEKIKSTFNILMQKLSDRETKLLGEVEKEFDSQKLIIENTNKKVGNLLEELGECKRYAVSSLTIPLTDIPILSSSLAAGNRNSMPSSPSISVSSTLSMTPNPSINGPFQPSPSSPSPLITLGSRQRLLKLWSNIKSSEQYNIISSMMKKNRLDITESSSINVATFPIQNFNITFNPFSIIATQNRIETLGNICNSNCIESRFRYFLSKYLRKIDDVSSIDTSIVINIMHSSLTVCNGFFNKFYTDNTNLRINSNNSNNNYYIIDRTKLILKNSYTTGLSLINHCISLIYSSFDKVIIAILKKAGRDHIRSIRLSGVKISLFVAAGFTPKELLKGGFSREEIILSGFQIHELFL